VGIDMRLHNSSDRYGAVAVSLHWLTFLLVALAWALGQGMDILPRGDARTAGIVTHIALGLAVLFIFVVRFIWRMAETRPAAIPTPLGHWSDVLAEMVHYALYALLFAVPVVGIAYQFARGDLPVFGLFHIQSPLTPDRDLAGSIREVHETLANAIVLLAGFHAAAALAHHYLFRDRTLVRMLPHRS
jgi:cytochrome b561